MSYLHTKLCRIAEANYINQLMNGTPPVCDVAGYVHFNQPAPELPNDIIGVCRPNPNTLSGMGIVYMFRHQYEAEA
jgi:hypothetical protein